MKHTIKRIIGVLIFVFLLSFTASETEKNNIEKVYAHTDRTFYFPSETIWFKAYVVDAKNEISTKSDAMIAELISPKGAVVKNLKLKIDQGFAYGNFDISQDWVGGSYTLRCYTNWMKNYGEEVFFNKKITVQKVVKPNVLLNLKFEKEGYGKSSIVTANFEAKDLKNNPLVKTEISYAVFAKGNSIIESKTKTDAKGKANLTFTLPNSLTTTDILLNVLVPYKGSTESISRSVPVVLDNIDLQFFPESGKIIAGTKNTIAFKALNEFGKPVDVAGDIYEENGTKITSFLSFHDGMGGFEINAKKDVQYVAKITSPFVSERKITLPKTITNGTRFSVNENKGDVQLSFFSSNQKALKVEVRNNNAILHQEKLKSNQKKVTISTKDFPSGITKFAVLDTYGNILAERLVFIDKQKKLLVTIDLDKEVYKTREKVAVKVKTTNVNGEPIPANLSFSVADNKLISFADDKQDHISSYLLMSSELKGNIHKPIFYFDDKESKAAKALDYVMLTHGWRNYHNKNINLENATYKPEKQSVQTGKVTTRNGKPVQAHLLLFDTNGDKVGVFETDENGRFAFKITTGVNYALMAYTDDKRTLQIHKNKFIKGNNPSNQKTKLNTKNKELNNVFFDNKKPLGTTVKGKVTEKKLMLDSDAEALEEIVIIGYGTTKKSALTGSVSVIHSEEITTSASIGQFLQGRVAGVQVVSNKSNTSAGSTIRIRGSSSLSGNNQPLIIIDGMVKDINQITPSDVKSITVLKDAAATSLYGSRGANGVIIVTSKNGGYNNYGKKRLNNAKFNNYAVETFFSTQSLYFNKAREFYIPKYDSKNEVAERTDFRQTIYWNPVVQTDENGEATFEYYNSDAVTSFKIIAEGVGYNGLLGRKEKTYSTKRMLNVDFKAPNYMALDDVVVLPITITNETDEKIDAKLDVQLPKGIQLLGSYDKKIVIPANGSTLKNIRIVPFAKSKKAMVKITVTSKSGNDVIHKEVEVISPFFPTKTSISGFKNQDFSFNVNNAVPNSATATFTLYTDIVGDVMNGVESLLRQPWGCFEQVSSSTYPNILVLKYLKETGKSNPEIEAKALSFIKKGYQKLAAYETTKDGFEWYGKTPPHEALSAYGLMQFTEMKEVFDGVNEKMLERTVNYLMRRKNGKGGFLQNSGKYGFSAAPKNVNNAYIVYAISESGITADIQKEYETAYYEALQSEDVYRMSLLLLASHNLGKMNNANTLLQKLEKQIANHGFGKLPASSTITRSYGQSRGVEVTAFTILSLLRMESNEHIVKGIEYLLGNRKYGRFGSTQATSMALKALIEYTKTTKNKMITDGDLVTVVINGKKVNASLELNNSGKIDILGIEKYLVKGKQNVSVSFSNKEATFPYSLTVNWDSTLPDSSKECKLSLATEIGTKATKVGDNVRMTVSVKNKTDKGVSMPIAIVGIPSGATPQPWQLQEIVDREEVAFYEVFDNYLVFYWREFGPNENRIIQLDLKADIAGTYQAPASTAYLYYADEDKHWIKGNRLEVKE